MEITIAKYAGMCGGVKYTIVETNNILDNNKDRKVYALGELVHNKIVVEKLEAKGMTTVEDIEEIPDNSIVIFRAHGVTKDTYKRAEEKHLEIHDLTCKNVLSIHEKIKEKKIH